MVNFLMAIWQMAFSPGFLASLLGIFELGTQEAMKETKIKEFEFFLYSPAAPALARRVASL
jgi:hypothetical protein